MSRALPYFMLLFFLGHLETLAAAAGGGNALQWDNPVVNDVPASFARITGPAVPLGVWGGPIIPYPFYSLNALHDYGDNHFQGLQRLRRGNYFVISGGNIGRRGNMSRYGLPKPATWQELPDATGHLFILNVSSRPEGGRLGSNLDPTTGLPMQQDRTVAKVEIAMSLPSGTRLWHPGGISVLGDILVVPVENYNKEHGDVCSQILFYDVSQPRHPTLMPVLIDRTVEPVKDKAGGAAMIRLPDGRFMVASRTSTHVSFYLSRSAELTDGFAPLPSAVVDERKVQAIAGMEPTKFGGSSLQFIKQRDGSLFLVGYSTRKALPEENRPEQQVATLWRVEFPSNDYTATPALIRTAERVFTGPVLGREAWGLFGAASGLFISDHGEIALYAAVRWQVRRAGDPTVEDVARNNGVRPDEPVFIPMAELWPGP